MIPPQPMEQNVSVEVEQARSCSAEDISALLYSPSEPVLAALLQNPRLKEVHVRALLERRDLKGALLEQIAVRKDWVREPGLRRCLVAHLHMPSRVAMKLARDLEVMDLAAISLQSSVPAPVRRFADDLLLRRIAQLPLGQKLALARRGPGRVAGELLPGGDERIARAALDNVHLTEAQLLRALASEKLTAGTLSVIASHAKWGCFGAVRAALVRHPHAPLERVLSFLPDLPLPELRQLCTATDLRASLRRAIRCEMEERAARQSSTR